MWEEDIGVFPVLFEQQGDEWAHHLGIELTGDGRLSARGSDGTSPVELGPPLSGPVTSKLYIHPHQDGIRCTVVGEGETASVEQMEPWRRAAQAAVAALGHRNQVFVWEAMVGTSPHSLGLDRLGELKGSQDLGPVLLSPGGVCMRELRTHGDRVDQQGFGIRHSFPVIATGPVDSYVWERVEPIAESCLRRACALLSLATGTLWIPRSHPRQVLDGQERLRVPAAVGPITQIAHLPEEPEWHGQVPPDTPLFDLPSWIHGAWRSLDADGGLATAVNAHYEAMRLHHAYPSIAHFTYVAAIEGFGMRLVADAPCDCHPQCTHMKGVAEKRFRKALKTVLTNREIKQFAGLAYNLRSYTGHRGSLFGSEDTFGYSPVQLFYATSDLVFDVSLLGELRHVSGRVLVKALTDAQHDERIG